MFTFRNLYALPLLGLLSSGCGEPVIIAGETPTLNGQIAGWSRGTGYSVEAVIRLPDGVGMPLTTAEVSATGIFKLELPSDESVAMYLTPTLTPQLKKCMSRPTISPENMNSGSLLLSVKRTGELDTYLLLYNRQLTSDPQMGDVQGDILYADRTGTFVGRAECTTVAGTVITDNNLQLHKGWNYVVTKIGEFSSGPDGTRIVSSSETAPSLPLEVQWQVMK